MWLSFAAGLSRVIVPTAVVGEKRWQKGMTTFCKPFTKAEIRYFHPEQAEEARSWLQQELAVTK